MSDTPENQAVYPQHSNQASGCGFPIAKIIVMFSLVTGAAMEVLIAAFKTSEIVLARQLYHNLMPGEVVLAFPCLWDLRRFSIGAVPAGRCGISPRIRVVKVISDGAKNWALATILLLGINQNAVPTA